MFGRIAETQHEALEAVLEHVGIEKLPELLVLDRVRRKGANGTPANEHRAGDLSRDRLQQVQLSIRQAKLEAIETKSAIVYPPGVVQPRRAELLVDSRRRSSFFLLRSTEHRDYARDDETDG
jgi:hypothetical protein